MEGKKIIEYLNKWYKEGTMFPIASTYSTYQTKKMIAQGELFRSLHFPNLIFKDEGSRSIFDGFFNDPFNTIFVLDDLSKSGFHNRYDLEKAIQRQEVVKFKKLVKPVFFVKINH